MEPEPVGAERRRNRTFQAGGCPALPALKAGWATRPVPLRARDYGLARGGKTQVMADDDRDPYMRDPNIARAASMQVVAGLALGAMLGWAVAGWFNFGIGLGIGVGAVVGFLLANVLIYQYGGRSTR